MDDKTELYKALLKCNFPHLEKKQEGIVKGGKAAKFVPLVEIYAAIIPVLKEQGIVFYHAIEETEQGKKLLITSIIHAPTGQHIEDKRYLMSENPGNTGWGGAESYAKRYAIQSLLGITGGDECDDDGKKEQEYIEQKTKSDKEQEYIEQKTKSDAPPKKKLTGADFKHLSIPEAFESLVNTLDSAGNKRWLIDRLYEHNKVDAIKDIPKENIYSSLAFVVNAKIRKGIA